MRHDWLVAQLDAMKHYAQQNNLPELAEALQTAKLLALTEIASVEGEAPPPTCPNAPRHSE
ncbi:hypothetical protein [Roseinatronobacter sp. NSM]|uniref:hypothetical protein n=1 Tax=Roseinatronobacter sp. NSM TaxID=3457785 RepID=UPI0040369460